MRKVYLVALMPFLLSTAHAICVDEVDALSKKYGVASTLPKTTGNTAATSDQLAASGGVIAPPATGDTPAITPALPNPDAMQTAPAMVPQTANGATVEHQGTDEHAAAAISQAAALLLAARQAGRQGDEAACEQGLAKAQAMLAQ